MLAGIRTLLEKTNNPERSAYLWNAINAALAAVECPVILMVMTRTNGMYDAGVFSIAYAVASLMMYLGQYGLRRYQSSDVLEKFSFREYHGVRFLTCSVMVLASLGYCVYGTLMLHYNLSKFLVIMIVCMLKYVQAYTDVFHGRMQQKGRLDVATKCSAARYVLEMLTCCLFLVFTKNMLLAASACLAVSVAEAMLTSVNEGKHYGGSLKPAFSKEKTKLLMIEGFPIFVSLFLNVYIGNAPKYAIDACLTEEIQAYYNFIFMPAFVVGLIAHFIFNPIITTYAKLWVANEKDQFVKLVKLIRKQCYIILGITALGLAVAFTIGIPLISFVFGADVSDYKRELVIIMVGGGMLAYATFFATVLTIIRKQRVMLICYAVAAASAFLVSRPMVIHFGMTGAAVLYAIIMTVLAIMLFITLYVGIKKERKELK